MSSLGGQWRVLAAELDKLAQRVRASPAHWNQLVSKVEKAVSLRLMEGRKVESTQGLVDTPAAGDSGSAPPRTNTLTKHKVEDKVEWSETSTAGSGSRERRESDVKELWADGLWAALRLRKDVHFGNVAQPSWKDHRPTVNKSSIHARTAYVVSALVCAHSSASLLKRTEDFIHHVNQYPEARDYAIKEGAVRALLRIQDRVQRSGEELDREVQGNVNEALAMMGWAGPPRGRGPAILSLDGGGIRGLIAIEVLRHLERLTGTPVNRLFDYIIGVSTGAIIAAVIGSGVGTLETASKMYLTLSKEMFGNTSLISGTSRLVWTHSYYDTAQWEKMLRDNLGELTLTQCNRHPNPKMALVSCVVNSGRLSPFVFRTYSGRWRTRGPRGTQAARVWHAVRASAAAPTYFEEFTLDHHVHQDGGLMVNNPTGLGMHEARLVFGARALQDCTVVSVGTGQVPAAARAAAPQPTSWRDKFYKILDSATDTEGVHLLLNDLLPCGQYYRLNPPLLAPCDMDEVDPAKLQALIDDTHAYIRRNQHKFSEAAARLMRRRTLAQRLSDNLQRRAILLGLTHPH